MLLTCALARIIWLATAGSWPQLFLCSHQRRHLPGPSPGLVMVFSVARLAWKQHGNQFPFCNMSPISVHAFAAVSLLPSRSHIG